VAAKIFYPPPRPTPSIIGELEKSGFLFKIKA
jgi:hypothetical protein